MASRGRRPKFCLPEDIIVEILSRLPVKDLLRFKCLCTQWRTLISSPSFATLHLNRSISNPTNHSILVLVQSFYKNKFMSFDPSSLSPIGNYLNQPNPFGPRIMCVGSINGVLCISERSTKWIWLWNPSTRLFKRIPPPGINKRVFSLGFGCDPIANDYKVVQIGCRYTRGETRTWVKVWSANSDSWRKIKVDHNFRPRDYVCDVIVEGFNYWIVNDKFIRSKNILVASFDVKLEVLRLIPAPEVLSEDKYAFYGLKWKEKFGLAAYDAMEPSKAYQVWTIENNAAGKESWSKKFTFELDVRAFRSTINTVNGKIVLGGYGTLIFYDLETRKMKTVTSPYRSLAFEGPSHYYVESLITIPGFIPLDEDAENTGLRRSKRRLCHN